MSIRFSVSNPAKTLRVGDLKYGQMGRVDDSTLVYCDGEGRITMFMNDDYVGSASHETKVTPMPPGSEIIIRSEV